MDGAQALRYARSRHTSTDFDRGQRQQRVLLSLREQANPQELIPRLPELVKALKKTVQTDIPIDQLAELLGLASSVDTTNIRSYVFPPPLYADRVPERPARLHDLPERPEDPGRRQERLQDATRATRRSAEKLADEGASIWVPQRAERPAPRGRPWPATSSTAGLAASAPRQKPAGRVPADTRIVVYNGAADQYPGHDRLPREDASR